MWKFISLFISYFKNSYKKMLSFQKVFKNVLTFKGLGVRLTLNRLGGGALGAPILVFLPASTLIFYTITVKFFDF